MDQLNGPTRPGSVFGAALFTPFPTTRWTMVAEAGHDETGGNRDALGRLLVRYMPALRLYLVANFRLAHDRAEDMLQGFIADKILEKKCWLGPIAASADSARS